MIDRQTQIIKLRNENKLYEARMREKNVSYREKNEFGKKILANNKAIKNLEKLSCYVRVYPTS